MICVGFTHDAKYVCTGDMSGLIKVWLMSTLKEVWSFEEGDMEVRDIYQPVTTL